MSSVSIRTNSHIKSSVPDVVSITERFKTIHQQLNQQTETARKATKYDADKRRKEGTANKIDDEVMISTKNVRTDRPTKKLDYRWTDDDGDVIEDIVDVRKKGRGFEYLIKWEGYSEQTWEPRSHLQDDKMLRQWHSVHP
ncbi:hypothetical protein SeLEV6574_g07130 [Synchytrium endobioticum]|uniref:Chromo domain-containing protein n=1 Tax=Synchytrium endobioticum TaxID=286115 RepID=A0A507CM73_9FUNG|nr:hypothetical protein SeLEV6574_g07130 [Synchytrium endobioticum]